MSNENWRCPRCGNTTKHYSSARLAEVCDLCGHPVEDHALVSQRQSYDRTMALAQQHLRVGNWKECRTMLQPLSGQNPADSRLYTMMFEALTCSYTDYLNGISDTSARKEAEGCWDRLERLNKITSRMRTYASERKRACEQRLLHDLHVGLVFAMLMAVCIIMIAFASVWWTVALLILAAGFLSFLTLLEGPIRTWMQLRELQSGAVSNPMRW